MIDKLRFILNTHEQVSHPYQLSVLIRYCTFSEEQRTFNELLSCLTEKLNKMNRRACEFLIDLALKMELLETALHWSARGWVINQLTSGRSDLTEPEKIAYLKYYLDTDGALIMNFLGELVQTGEQGMLMSHFLNEGGVERVFVNTAETYLQEVFDISPRYELSKLLSLREKNYSKSVRTDKFIPHIEPLVDLGFVSRSYDGKAVRYAPVYRNENGKSVNHTSVLYEQFNRVLDLDKIFSREGDFFRRATVCFRLPIREFVQSKDYPIIKREIIRAYNETKDQYFRLARLNSIYDLVCIRMLYAKPHRKLCEEWDVNRIIQQMNLESEEDIRFHVDDMGIIRYVTISEDYVKNEMD